MLVYVPKENGPGWVCNSVVERLPRIGKVLASISNYKKGEEGREERRKEDEKNRNLITVFIMSGKGWPMEVGKRPSLRGPENHPKLVLTLRGQRVLPTRMSAFL